MKEKIFSTLILISLLSAKENSALSSSVNKIDSLKALLQSDKEDTVKARHLNELAWKISKNDPDSAITLGNRSLLLSEKLNWDPGIANACNNLGWFYYRKNNYDEAEKQYKKALDTWKRVDPASRGYFASTHLLGNISLVYSARGNYPVALDYLQKALLIDEKSGNKNDLILHYGNIGIIYESEGNYSKALDYFFKSLKMADEMSDKEAQARDLYNIAAVYNLEKESNKALEYYFKVIKIDKDLGDQYGLASDYGNMALAYDALGREKESLEYNKKALEIDKLVGNKRGMAIRLTNIGSNLKSLGDTSQLLSEYNEALRLAQEIGFEEIIASNLANIGSVYSDEKKYSSAIDYVKKALTLSHEMGAADIERLCRKILYETYKAMGNMSEALLNYEYYVGLNDSIFTQENRKELVQKEMKYQYEKKETADSLKTIQEKKIAAAQSKQEETLRYSLLAGLALLMTFAVFIFNRYKITQKQKKIIEEQKQIVEEKQKEVMDSIHYAKRIQRSLLPTEKYIERNFKRLRKNRSNE